MALRAPPLKLVSTVNVGNNGFKVELFSNVAAVRKQVARFNKRGVRRAEFRAINRALTTANAAMKRDIASSYNLTQKTFASHLSTRKASFNTLTAWIQGSGTQIPIIKAKGKPKQLQRGVSVNTGTGKRVKAGTFIARMPNGHVGIFQRKPGWKHVKTKSSGGVPQLHGLGISELKYPPVGNMVSTSKRGVRVFDIFSVAYQKRLFNQLNFEADKLGAR